MRSACRASLIVAFHLLASAATAQAECAWVLWSESTSPDPRGTGWRIINTSPDENRRRLALTSTLKSNGKHGLEGTPSSGPRQQATVLRSSCATKRVRLLGPRYLTCTASPTRWTRAGRGRSERHRRPSLAPLAPHQTASCV
jgi:hypothetical protein